MNRNSLCLQFVRTALLLAICFVATYALTAVADVVPAGVIPTPTPDTSPLQIFVNKGAYSPGDAIQITVKSGQAGYLYLYDIDPAGAITLLYPNIYQPDAHVTAGTLSLPGEGYHFVVGGPEGLETVAAILSSSPLALLAPSEKVAFRTLDVKPQSLVQELSVTLTSTTWASAWAQFVVYQPKGNVHIESVPRGARIRINGQDRGVAPKNLVLPAGEATITLEKSGYASYSQTIIVHDQDTIDIDARLKAAVPAAAGGVDVLPMFGGLDVGEDSIGFEVGFMNYIGVATGIRFTAEEPLVPGEMYNVGPEIDVDLRLHVPLIGGISIVLGGGIGLQNTALAPSVTQGVTPSAITIEPDIETEVFPSFVAGVEINLGHASLFAGYHLRRGGIVGIGVHF